MKRAAPALSAALVGLAVIGLSIRHERLAAEQAKRLAHAQPVEKTEPAKPDSAEASDTKPTAKDLLTGPTDADPAASGRFHLMPDGSPVPGLPTSAPERVKLGVILFRYKGSQGAAESTRSRESAQALAKEAIELAKTDFTAAARKGDRGSSDNIGWIPQRILERSVEHAVFTLAEGDISLEPIDTPRGFWVAKRIR